VTARPLRTDELRWRCDLSALGFARTDELEAFEGGLGQERATAALDLGIGLARPGYNVFALGPRGLDQHGLVRRRLESAAAGRPVPDDLAYVNNFDEARRPIALRLPAGRGAAFRRDTDRLVDEVRDALRAAFEAQDYRERRQMIEQELQDRQQRAFSKIEEEGRGRGVAVSRTPQGFAFAPIRDGRPLSGEEAQQLSETEREEVQKTVEDLQGRLRELMQTMPEWVKETREKLNALNEETARQAVGHLFETLKQGYADLAAVTAHLERVERDIVDNAETILAAAQQETQGADQQNPMQASAIDKQAEGLLRRYRTNLAVDHAEAREGPVVYEDDPTYERLVGRIEHRAEMGALTTDFHLIRAGALHRASGGYLMLDARKVLTRPLAWEALKRALRAGELRIEPPHEALGLVSTVSLEPEAVPLDVKVVLIGERGLHHLLSQLDPEFAELFKVAADFEERTDRGEASLGLYARMIATTAGREALAPFSAQAVGRVLEEAARLAGDREKLSTEVESVADLVREADHAARQAGHNPVDADAVDRAVAAREHRHGRLRECMLEEIERGTVRIETEGARTGAVNALTVTSLGGFSFGRPVRVSAQAGVGRGTVTDIEREVELGGPVHSKGVLILTGFLTARFARDTPLSLGASLVFEQSYGEVEGDSASLAELLALLSAISGLPLRQDLAVTGSISQHGHVQPIGGVNEKIEGFFDLCAARGLTGDQGVAIPAANARHLMLRGRVYEAVEAGRFSVTTLETVDDALGLFTGLAAGAPDEEGTAYAAVQSALDALAERRRRFAGGARDD